MTETSSSAPRPSIPAGLTPATIALGARLVIRDIEEAHRLLLEALNREGSLRLDASRVAAIDASGIQLLLAVRKEGMRRGLSIEIVGASPALDRAATLRGVRAELGRGEAA